MAGASPAGAILGLFINGPIAAGDTFRSAFVRRHFQQFERWSAFFLALRLGHWIGMMLGDNGIISAFAFRLPRRVFSVLPFGLTKRPAA